LRRRSGWNARQSLATKIPFPKSADVSFEKAAGSVKRHSDIAILVRGGRDFWTVDQI
jgi:hypothetical protein